MRRFLPFSLFAFSIILVTAFDTMSSNGKAGYTGSSGETYCTNCHSGTALNGGGGSISISGPTSYIPSSTYTVSVTVSQANDSLFGFGFEALTSSNANAGTFTITNTTETQLMTAFNGRKNVTHKFNGGATANSHTFTFHWTAPSTNVGNVTFYAVGNAANGNGNDTGDKIYSTSQVVSDITAVSAANSENAELITYPNPATDRLNIKYNLPTHENVSVKLYSVDGRAVYSLLDESQDAGDHAQQLNLPSNVTPGIYFIVLNAGSKTSAKKIIIQ